ncbi:hypothetical protein GDO81_011712 [Engystomops pustulosus]|uniref:Shelterin complex subunit TPP1/Est3 domain-containing protein n=1 Tax=Engystomops pustulosus TaxID=76066 RepID=A0AAV7BGS1_ENGPU|nr:hypothetical protein GDO81_011712 [Engystomops pustulosus]
MAGYHSFIGYPWIIDCLAKYDSATAKQKPVPGQVVEFLRMPDQSVLEDSKHPEAVINISDQKYYIRAVITKEAQQTLERDDDHFTLADLKNKMIILKQFSVCFTAVEDLRRCEFYLTVQHFSVLPMETNTVDILNCNMEPGVRQKIKELWQNYMTELEMNETSSDMNLSDVSLTQLLMIASEEKFSALKAIAEQCLDLDPVSTQDISPQTRTFWSLERKKQQVSPERFVIPVHLLLIPPHEEEVLEQMSEFRYEGQCPSEPADTSQEDDSSQPFSTALSTLSEDPVDEGPSDQYGNPWNNLQSLCVSVPPSSESQPTCSPSLAQNSRGNDVGSDADSSTPDIFTSDADISMDYPKGRDEISPLMFSERSSNPQESSTSKPETDHASSNTSPKCGQGRSLNTSTTSLSLIPLTQDSPCRSVTATGNVSISPVKSHELHNSTTRKIGMFSVSDDSDISPRRRKVSKRKKTTDDRESPHSDLEQQDSEIIERPDCVTTPASSSEDRLYNNGNRVQAATSTQVARQETEAPGSDMKKNISKPDYYNKTRLTENHTPSKRRIQAHKPSLQFVVNPKILSTKDSADQQLTAKSPPTGQDSLQKTPTNTRHGQSSCQAKEKSFRAAIEVGKTELAHPDGTSFQYKYKAPSEDLCALVNSLQIPADLSEWAVKMLSEGQEKLV